MNQRESRACEHCGFVRKVKLKVYEDADYTSKLCTACDLDRSARVHLAMASKLSMKARAIRARRRASGG